MSEKGVVVGVVLVWEEEEDLTDHRKARMW